MEVATSRLASPGRSRPCFHALDVSLSTMIRPQHGPHARFPREDPYPAHSPPPPLDEETYREYSFKEWISIDFPPCTVDMAYQEKRMG